MSPLHEAARRYALAGIPVFCCRAGSKDPACAGGFHAATTDLTQIDEWWEAEPDLNVAFTPHSIGWGCIDIDSSDAERAYLERSEAEGEEADETWTVRTPRGGLHLYYQGELPTSVGTRIIPGQKIDTRGRGSYALLPPSRTSSANPGCGDGEYVAQNNFEVAPLPLWVEAAIVATEGYGRAETDWQGGSDLPVNVGRATEYLQRAAPAIEGQFGNKRTFTLACELFELDLSAATVLDLMQEHWNERCLPPWEEDELEQVVANAGRYMQNQRGLRADAGGANPSYARYMAEEGGSATANGGEMGGSRSKKRAYFYPEDETEQEQGAEASWLIPNLIPDNGTVLLYGPTQSYKSFLGLDLALSTASGCATFAGAPTRTGPVFYAALEGRTNLKKARRRAWKLARGVAAVPDFYVMPAPMLGVDGQAEEFAAAIQERCAGRRPAGIYLDTLAKVMAGMNENDARDMGTAVRFADQLAERFECPVVYIHHTGRDESHERGSSAAKAGVDTVIKVSAHRATKMMTIRVEKHKDAEEREEPWFMAGELVGQSLVFSPVSPAEHAAATQADSLFTRAKVGAALLKLGARGEEHAISSYVLAATLTPQIEGEDHETREKKVASTERALAKLGRKELAGYVTGEGRDRKWSLLPAEKVLEGEDYSF
jgi:hypothetical protein